MSSLLALATGRDRTIDTRRSAIVGKIDAPLANLAITTKQRKLEYDGTLYLLAVMQTLDYQDLDEIDEKIEARITRADSEGREVVWTEQLYDINGQKFQIILPAGQSCKSAFDTERLQMSRKYQNFMNYVIMGILVIINIMQMYQLFTFEPITLTPFWTAIFTFLSSAVFFTYLMMQFSAVTFGQMLAFDVTQTDPRGNPIYRCIPVDSLNVPLSMYFSQIEILKDTIPKATQMQIASLQREVERLQQAKRDADAEIKNLETQNMSLRKRLENSKIRRFFEIEHEQDVEEAPESKTKGAWDWFKGSIGAQMFVVIAFILIMTLMMSWLFLG
jgi:hypothetical protein